METPLYQYQTLQHSDSIRIVDIHPNPNELDPIVCTIRHVQFSDDPLDYEAVSYTWGDSTQTKTIYFDDGMQRLVVGQNCHATLRRLRLAHRSRAVWIDAVCIDQENLRERGHQVCIMNDVYSYAAGVMVMLSDEVPDCRLLLAETAEVSKKLKLGTVRGRAKPGADIVRELETLFEDPWFKRTWVLQEVYEKPYVTMVYGSAIIPFHALLELYFGYGDTRVTRYVGPQPFVIIFQSMVRHSTLQFSLWNRLYQSRRCLATDPRDKIFALKTLLGPSQAKLDHIIDYAQSVEDCFKRVALFLLPVLGLRILAATRHPHTMDMASWIPDWSQTSSLDFNAFSFESDEARGMQDLSWAATPDDYERALRSYSIESLRKGMRLHVMGCQHARIAECSDTYHFIDIHDAERQMRDMYNGLNNLRRCLEAEDLYEIATTISDLSENIFEGECGNPTHYAQR